MRRVLLLTTLVPIIAVMATARAQQPPTPLPPLTVAPPKPAGDPCAAEEKRLEEDSEDLETTNKLLDQRANAHKTTRDILKGAEDALKACRTTQVGQHAAGSCDEEASNLDRARQAEQAAAEKLAEMKNYNNLSYTSVDFTRATRDACRAKEAAKKAIEDGKAAAAAARAREAALAAAKKAVDDAKKDILPPVVIKPPEPKMPDAPVENTPSPPTPETTVITRQPEPAIPMPELLPPNRPGQASGGGTIASPPPPPPPRPPAPPTWERTADGGMTCRYRDGASSWSFTTWDKEIIAGGCPTIPPGYSPIRPPGSTATSGGSAPGTPPQFGQRPDTAAAGAPLPPVTIPNPPGNPRSPTNVASTNPQGGTAPAATPGSSTPSGPINTLVTTLCFPTQIPNQPIMCTLEKEFGVICAPGTKGSNCPAWTGPSASMLCDDPGKGKVNKATCKPAKCEMKLRQPNDPNSRYTECQPLSPATAAKPPVLAPIKVATPPLPPVKVAPPAPKPAAPLPLTDSCAGGHVFIDCKINGSRAGICSKPEDVNMHLKDRQRHNAECTVAGKPAPLPVVALPQRIPAAAPAPHVPPQHFPTPLVVMPPPVVPTPAPPSEAAAPPPAEQPAEEVEEDEPEEQVEEDESAPTPMTPSRRPAHRPRQPRAPAMPSHQPSAGAPQAPIYVPRIAIPHIPRISPHVSPRITHRPPHVTHRPPVHHPRIVARPPVHRPTIRIAPRIVAPRIAAPRIVAPRIAAPRVQIHRPQAHRPAVRPPVHRPPIRRR
jgi:hypothetical protein